MSRIAALLITLSLAACGTKGALTLPPGPPPTPVFGIANSAADVSTPSTPQNQ